MGVKTETNTSSRTLESACARNVSVELHQSGADDEVLVAFSRLLDLDVRNVYLDKPKSRGTPLAFGQGKVVDVHLSLAGDRYVFRARVTQPVCTVKLNASTRVRGMSLSRPTVLDDGQRREDFRVSLASIDPVDVHFHTFDTGNVNRCQVDAERFRGQLIDLSRGGISVRVAVEDRATLRVDEQFFVHCRFPDDVGEITMLAQVAHVRSIVHGEAVRAGLRFLPWCQSFTAPHHETIARFSIDQQRRSIRRVR